MVRKIALCGLITAALTLALTASNGTAGSVTLISQAKVIRSGGFPYKITASGTYILICNLTVSSNLTNAINVTANNVTINLNGFSIVGPGSDSGAGITATGEFRTTLENGTVEGFSGDYGIILGDESIVRNVHSDSNFNGVTVGNNSIVAGCTTNHDESSGVSCLGSNCAISGNTATFNSTYGIYCNGSGCLVNGNTINDNVADGLIVIDGTTGYGTNIMNGNGTNVSGGTSMKNNVCGGALC